MVGRRPGWRFRWVTLEGATKIVRTQGAKNANPFSSVKVTSLQTLHWPSEFTSAGTTATILT